MPAVKPLSTLLTGLFLVLSPYEVSALEQFHCSVENFIGFSDDENFKRKNRRKTFTLQIENNEIMAFVKSKDFRDYENRYAITAKNKLVTIAISDSVTSLDALVIPPRPRRTIRRKGYFNATVATQSNHYLNTWLLRCTE
ncbi:hypothetical protein [Marimonas arenosa]|uniref:Uncharacterized protein n=1 Tax=Marimonas arenosa TaxID=1795305 RepID=A0AAE3W9V8_9RHOB|nr:hypothetical protein [Marimonas arenosa]MDQ2089266.1 hypothetical protein [Marimonas arenosa]